MTVYLNWYYRGWTRTTYLYYTVVYVVDVLILHIIKSVKMDGYAWYALLSELKNGIHIHQREQREV